ncbi:hypothetical protein ACJZ2D_005429 [Fusarium nematophilum]
MEPASPESTSPRTPPASGAIRRIRQACIYCRRRKIKCSGDRPTCVRCRNRNRICIYEPYSEPREPVPGTGSSNAMPGLIDMPQGRPSPPALAESDPELFRRISSIEAQLSMVTRHIMSSSANQQQLPSDHSQSPGPFTHSQSRPSAANTLTLQLPPASNQAIQQAAVSPLPNLAEESSAQSEVVLWGADTQQEKSTGSAALPPYWIAQTLVDIYFLHVHNQPYSYFQEESFRLKLDDGLVPKYLVLAVLASALRFSDHDYFRGRIQQTMESYAKEAWLLVVKEYMMGTSAPKVEVVQAAGILAVIEFAAGRAGLAWLKAGTAIRFAQDLGLADEPSPLLSIVDQEEQRRVFWSVFLLDRVIACGKRYPTTISERDCHVRLPSSEHHFREGLHQKTATLGHLLGQDAAGTTQYGCGGFALTIFVASVLGRCLQYAILGHNSTGTHLSSKAELSDINMLLREINSLLHVNGGSIDRITRENRTLNGALDHQALAHIVFAHVIFHTCHCLLNHPYLLRLHLKNAAPEELHVIFSRGTAESYEHACRLVAFLHDAEDAGCHINAPFYTYSICLAGSILMLSMVSAGTRGSGPLNSQVEWTRRSIEMVKRWGQSWGHASKVHMLLVSLETHTQALASVFDLERELDLHPEAETLLATTVDYIAMCGSDMES